MEEKYLNLVKTALLGELDTTCPTLKWSKDDCIKTIKQGNISTTVRTLVGRKRLDNIQDCVKKIADENIHGDFLEAGCWKGGASIFMKACIETYSPARPLWCADAFENNTKYYTPWLLTTLQPFSKVFAALHFLYPHRFKNWVVNQMNVGFPKDNYDKETINHYFNVLAKTPLATPSRLKHFFQQQGLDDVKQCFERYELLDDNVNFLQGWFADTLPPASQNIESLALLRADGDFYASTMDILNPLYPKLSPGGFCIIDDYGAFPECQRAVDKYREQHGITAPMHWIDSEAIFWRKIT